MWESRYERFPEHPPRTREYYLLRSIFESHFPHPDALKTVPQGLSIACSTPEALKWDPEWEDMHEIRWGRGAAGQACRHGVHS
jgi:asparagine synthase (glutamine-hydrolysing)